MVHYAGHGGLNQFDRLIFQANSREPRSVQFADAFLNHVRGGSDFAQHDPDVDVVMIIDSCCSGSATRALPTQTRRVVEILAACEPEATALGNKPSSAAVKARTQNRTFSAKLADIIAEQKGKGEPLSFAEMMTIVEKDSPKIKPFYNLFIGSTSVRLPFPDQLSTPAAIPSTLSSLTSYRAAVSICP